MTYFADLYTHDNKPLPAGRKIKHQVSNRVVVVVVVLLSRRTRLLQGDIIKVEACCRNFLVKTEC